ncbi:hypothetical protein Tco_1544147 [Tanacetum coccineum]
MAEEEEEKTAVHTNQGVFYYMKMAFSLKNAGATYQRLVDKAFEKQIGRKLENKHEAQSEKMHVRYRRISVPGPCGQHKRNQGLSRESRSGNEVTIPPDIERSPKPQWKTSKSKQILIQIRRKSLPFFKTLKRCIKKSDFQWIPESERAFQGIK